MTGYKPPEVRFWEKVDVSGDCWLWHAATDPAGYGRFRSDERTVLAHRWAWEALVGPIPEGLHIDHLCKVRNCVRPAHLEPVTPAENQRRSPTAIGSYTPKTHCIRGHEFTPENTMHRIGKNVYRRCRICHNERERLAKARKKATRISNGSP